jgi:hypothetical protein
MVLLHWMYRATTARCLPMESKSIACQRGLEGAMVRYAPSAALRGRRREAAPVNGPLAMSRATIDCGGG